MTSEQEEPYTPEESIRRARVNAGFTELADIYEYCYNHLEEWENGEIEPTDLPHVGSKENDVFSEFTGAIILRSIAFGGCWEYHVPADRQNRGGGESSSTSSQESASKSGRKGQVGGEPPKPSPEPDAWHWITTSGIEEVTRELPGYDMHWKEPLFAGSTIRDYFEEADGREELIRRVEKLCGIETREVFDAE